MKEHSELERLSAVATWKEEQRAFPGFMILFSFFSVIHVMLCFVAGASPLESAVVRLFALLAVTITVLLYAQWRYAPLAAYAFYPTLLAVLVDWDPPDSGFTWNRAVLTVILIGCTIVILSRLAATIKMASGPECTAERERIEGWIARFRTAHDEPVIIEFSAASFPYHDRAKIRVLRDNEWIVVAKSLSDFAYSISWTVFDVRRTKIEYFPEKRRLHIGKLKFRRVEFAPESMAAMNQLSQVVTAS